jgi:hypothetical protein
VLVQIVDAAGQTVHTLTAQPNATVSGDSVLLRPGQYTIVFSLTEGSVPLTPQNTMSRGTALDSQGVRTHRALLTSPRVGRAAMAYSLRGSSLSGPIGPRLNDPTFTPTYLNPGQPGSYKYPDGVVSLLDFRWIGLFV